MAGRRSVWSDPAVIAAAADFVAATDEVWRLQRGKDPECVHFQAMANQGHYGGRGGTRQGIYVLTASGKLLSSVNALDPKRVFATMQEGLQAWRSTGEMDRTLPADWTLPRRRWEDSYPKDGLVLRSFNCDLGPKADRKRLNRDHVWFTADEARGWLGDSLEVGATHDVSRTIVERLASFHLVDNVRGQTLPFAPVEVAASRIRTTILSAGLGAVHFRIEGETRGETDGTWKLPKSDWTPTDVFPRSVTTHLLGRGSFNTLTKRFYKMEFVAVGERSGRTNLNGRPEDDVGPAPIGFFFEVAPDRAAERVAPAFVDIYADWVVDPR